jgi:hypothetical protein
MHIYAEIDDKMLKRTADLSFSVLLLERLVLPNLLVIVMFVTDT